MLTKLETFDRLVPQLSGAKLWSLNPADFADLPDLALYDPAD